MDNINDENIQTLEESNIPADGELQEKEKEKEMVSLLPAANDENNTTNQNEALDQPKNEEEEKANEALDQPKNEELNNDEPLESKTSSKDVSAKFSSRSNQQAIKQDVRAYLEEKVFPILTNGLEELLKAVDERKKQLNEEEEEKIPEINPLFFLARYLMRNAPHSSSEASRESSQHSNDRNDSKDENAPKEMENTNNEESSNTQNDEESKPTEM